MYTIGIILIIIALFFGYKAYHAPTWSKESDYNFGAYMCGVVGIGFVIIRAFITYYSQVDFFLKNF